MLQASTCLKNLNVSVETESCSSPDTLRMAPLTPAVSATVAKRLLNLFEEHDSVFFCRPGMNELELELQELMKKVLKNAKCDQAATLDVSLICTTG
jgi:hypothetical protein